MDHLSTANLVNLTSLWKLMGIEPLACQHPDTKMYIAKVWPNRCWIESNSSSKPLEQTVKDAFLSSIPVDAIVPIFDQHHLYTLGLEQDLKDHGMAVSFTQKAMCLDLHQTLSVQPNHSLDVSVTRLKSEMNSDIQIWGDTASDAFGYRVNPLVIQSIANNPNVFLLLAKINGRAVATAMLLRSENSPQVASNVFGLHQMGVPAKYARQGIAMAVMHYVIDYCRTLGGHSLTLQASIAGEGLYKRIGFVEQFNIRNYSFK